MDSPKDYSHQSLVGRDFSEVNLTAVDLSYADLREANFAIARLQDANFAHARLTDINLGETKAFRSVVVNPDGRLIVTLDRDGDWRFWDAESGRELFFPLEETKSIQCVAFSPDGKILAIAGTDKRIDLWDAQTKEKLRTLIGHTGTVKSVAFSPDGRLLASGGSEDNMVRLWEVKSGRELKVLLGHTGAVTSLCFTPDGLLLASASDDYDHRKIALWEVESGNLVQQRNQFSSNIKSLAFALRGQVLLVLTGNDLIAMDLTGNPVPCLPGHTRDINSVAFSQDGEVLASGSDDKTVRLWEVTTGQELKVLQGHSDYVRSIAFSPGGEVLASGSEDKTVRLWEIATGQELKVLQGHERYVTSIAFSPNGQLVASSSEDKTVRLWEVATGQELKVLQGHERYVTSIAFSLDGQLIASGSDDQTVRLWEVATGQELKVLQGHSDYVRSVAFSPDGQLVASGSDDTTVRLWEVESGSQQLTIEGRCQLSSFSLLDEDNQVAVGAQTGEIEIWNLDNKQRIKTYALHKQYVNGLGYSRKTQTLIGVSADNSISLVDLTTGKHRSIRQELHCLRANIFGVIGLRDSQRRLMLSKGAIEIDPAELPQGFNLQDVRLLIRTRRIQNLSRQIAKGKTPTVLIIGPGTFMPPADSLQRLDFLRRERLFPLRFFRQDYSNLKKMQREFEYLYMQVIEDPRYWREAQDFYSEGLRKSIYSKERERQWKLIPSLRENYNALVELVNQRLFNVVIDFDVFSQLDRDMFSPSVIESSYSKLGDFRESFYRISKGLRYVEKGQTVFLKFFSEELDPKFIQSPSGLRRLFDELFDELTYRIESIANLIWTGFYPTELFYSLERLTRRETGENFFWVMDESIREDTSIAATYLDYSVGNFSDFFQDIYTETTISEQAELSKLENLSVNQLSYLAKRPNEQQHTQVAREVISRFSQETKSTQNKLSEIIESLRQNAAVSVRKALLEALFSNFTRLPAQFFNNLITELSHDSEETIRADIAVWIISRYSEVGETYKPLLLEKLAQDSSIFVRQRLLDAIKTRFEQLPTDIRRLASQLVGTPQIAVQILSGSGMLIERDSELVLQVTNLNNTVLDMVEIKIQPSAEYTVISANPVSLSLLDARQSAEVRFQLRVRVAKQITVNYRFNGELKEPPLFINAVKGNPYIYGDPVKEETAFIGRKNELEEIIQEITRINGKNILLVGERRMGKTSLLYQLQNRLEQPFIPVNVVLNLKPTAQEVLDLILNEVIFVLVEKNILDNNWENYQFPSNSTFGRNFRKIITEAQKKLPDIKIVLLLDEGDHFICIDETAQNNLRAALQELGSNLGCVINATSILSSSVVQSSSPLRNILNSITLNMLSVEETKELITKPASDLGYSYTEEVINRIISLSGGQPFCCQALCYEAFDYVLSKEQKAIENEALDFADAKVSKDLFESYFLGLWKRTNPEQKRFLINLAQNKSITKLNISQAKINNLIDWKLIKKEQDNYNFCSDLIKQWIIRVIKR